jgi:hypothetical protein
MTSRRPRLSRAASAANARPIRNVHLDALSEQTTALELASQGLANNLAYAGIILRSCGFSSLNNLSRCGVAFTSIAHKISNVAPMPAGLV